MGSAPLSAPFTLALTFRLHSRLRIYLYAALLPFLQAYSFVLFACGPPLGQSDTYWFHAVLWLAYSGFLSNDGLAGA